MYHRYVMQTTFEDTPWCRSALPRHHSALPCHCSALPRWPPFPTTSRSSRMCNTSTCCYPMRQTPLGHATSTPSAPQRRPETARTCDSYHPLQADHTMLSALPILHIWLLTSNNRLATLDLTPHLLWCWCEYQRSATSLPHSMISSYHMMSIPLVPATPSPIFAPFLHCLKGKCLINIVLCPHLYHIYFPLYTSQATFLAPPSPPY